MPMLSTRQQIALVREAQDAAYQVCRVHNSVGLSTLSVQRTSGSAVASALSAALDALYVLQAVEELD